MKSGLFPITRKITSTTNEINQILLSGVVAVPASEGSVNSTNFTNISSGASKIDLRNYFSGLAILPSFDMLGRAGTIDVTSYNGGDVKFGNVVANENGTLNITWKLGEAAEGFAGTAGDLLASDELSVNSKAISPIWTNALNITGARNIGKTENTYSETRTDGTIIADQGLNTYFQVLLNRNGQVDPSVSISASGDVYFEPIMARVTRELGVAEPTMPEKTAIGGKINLNSIVAGGLLDLSFQPAVVVNYIPGASGVAVDTPTFGLSFLDDAVSGETTISGSTLERYLVSESADKTVKVYELPDGTRLTMTNGKITDLDGYTLRETINGKTVIDTDADSQGNDRHVTFDPTTHQIEIGKDYTGTFTLSFDYENGQYLIDNVVGVTNLDIEQKNIEGNANGYKAVSNLPETMLVTDDTTISIASGTASVVTEQTTVNTETFDQPQDTYDAGTTGPVPKEDGSQMTTTIAYSPDGKTRTTTVTTTWPDKEPSMSGEIAQNLRSYLLNSEPVKAALRNGAFGDYNEQTLRNNVKFYAMNEQKDVFMAVYGDGVEFLGFFALGEPVVTTNRNTTTDGNTTTKTSSWSQTTPVISQFTMNVSYKDGIETRTETINASFKPGDTSASGTYDHDKKVSYEGDGHDSGMVTVTTPTLAGRSGTAVSYHPYTLVTYLVDEADNPIWEKNEDGSDRTDENGNKIQATESQTVWCYWLGEDFRFTAAQSPYLKVDGANYFEINETLNDEEEIIGGTVILTAKTSYTEQDVYVTEQNEAGQEVQVQLYDEEYIRAKNADGSLATGRQ